MEANIGLRIRKIRELKGYTQDYMAERLNLSQRAYSKIENNDIKVDWNRIVEISNILEVEPINLVTFDDSLIFNNCTQSGKLNVIHNNFPQELKESYESRISALTNEIEFLRRLIENKKP